MKQKLEFFSRFFLKLQTYCNFFSLSQNSVYYEIRNVNKLVW